MSKSRGNVINPDDVVNDFGADTLRLYEMFMGPLEASLPWSTKGLEGARKFLDRVYRLITEEEYTKKIVKEYDKELEIVYNQTVKKVTNDYDSLNFNTAISQMMIFVNECYKAEKIYIGFIEGLVKMLSCITPHLGEELWQILGHNNTIAYEAWPTYDEAKTVLAVATIVVQVNGKVRDKINVPMNASAEDIKKLAKNSERVKAFVENKEIVKEIVVPNKLYNIVVK